MSKQQLIKEIGSPIMMNSFKSIEEWLYNCETDKGANKQLRISFDTEKGVINKYEYYADNKTSQQISSDLVETLQKGISQLKEVEQRLGVPSKIILSDKNETWYYTSDNSMLIVYFDAQSAVKDYQYHYSEKK